MAVTVNGPLTATELTSLREYAATHGARWKAALREDWMGARAVGPLQALRNTRGPRWLLDFRLEATEDTRHLTTAADVAGEVRCVPSRTLDADAECSECGARLRPVIGAFVSDCGRYCARRCADAHAEFLAAVMNDERRRALQDGAR